MENVWMLVLVGVTGMLASFVGAQVGGSGLITVPMLMLLGLPPQVVLATKKVGDLAMHVGSFWRYKSSGHLLWKTAIYLALAAMSGSYLGAKWVLTIETDSLEKIIAVGMLLPLPFLLLGKFGGGHKKTRNWQRLLGYFLYFVCAWLAIVVPGGGTFFTYILVFCFGMSMLEMSATTKIAALLHEMIGLAVFILAGIVNWSYAIALAVGMVSGGYLGAHFAVRKGSVWMKNLLVGVVMVLVIKILWGS